MHVLCFVIILACFVSILFDALISFNLFTAVKAQFVILSRLFLIATASFASLSVLISPALTMLFTKSLSFLSDTCSSTFALAIFRISRRRIRTPFESPVIPSPAEKTSVGLNSLPSEPNNLLNKSSGASEASSLEMKPSFSSKRSISTRSPRSTSEPTISITFSIAIVLLSSESLLECNIIPRKHLMNSVALFSRSFILLSSRLICSFSKSTIFICCRSSANASSIACFSSNLLSYCCLRSVI
mmetsp:Transcript_10377/g.15705  ORF Transcript_10377/g.15705 Transcript_10377/m.15705 type:complete len:243 (-) Transcript_10377:557-1285(-)